MFGLSPLLMLHLAAAIVAIASGAAMFLMRKGTPLHRATGIVYITAMFAVIVSVIPVEATTLRIGSTRFGFFHVFIVVGFISLIIGLAALWRWRRGGKPKDLQSHQVNFAYSYAGLLMAGFSQIATNPLWGFVDGMGATQFWITFAALNAAIYAIASWLIITRIIKRDPLSYLPGRAA